MKCRQLRLKSSKEMFVTQKRIYIFDEDFWKNITPLTCYWAGFIAADGCLLNIKNKSGGLSKRFTLSLSTKDLKHLELFKKTIKSSHPIKFYQKKSPSSDNMTYQCFLSINCAEKWFEDLEKNFNIVPNKTHILPPPNILNKELEFSYLIGYIDGDGHITVPDHKVFGKSLTIGLSSSSIKILSYFEELIEKHFPYNRLSKKRNINSACESGNCKRYSLAGIKAAQIFNALKDFDLPKLDRKWGKETALLVLSQYKVKRPEFFL